MSMALHSGKLASENIHLFLSKHITREKMEELYSRQWEKQFSRRLIAGRRIQRLSYNPLLMDFLLTAGKNFTPLIKWLIRQTHGDPF
jgi:flavin-dependent dehydrogenase